MIPCECPDEQPETSEDHERAERLAHGKRAEHCAERIVRTSELRVGLAEELDDGPEQTVAEQEYPPVRSCRKALTASLGDHVNRPDNQSQQEPFSAGLIQLGWVA